MNDDQFDKVNHGRGFFAALDQSGGSTPKALALYGIDQDEYADDEYADHDAEDREEPSVPEQIPDDEPEADVLEQRAEVSDDEDENEDEDGGL